MIALKYKLYKTPKLDRIESLNLTACIIWNHCIALQRRHFSLYGKSIGNSRLQRHIRKMRYKNPYWYKLPCKSVEDIVKRQDAAYQRFFKKLAKRPPKFKKLKNFKSFVYRDDGYKLYDNKLLIRNIGVFKFSKSREYENVKRITLKKDSVRDWYLIVTCDLEQENYKRVGHSTIGLDFGLKSFLTTNSGEEIESPLFFHQYSKKITRLNKCLSHKKIGSKNRGKALNNLAKTHRKLQNKREDFQWKLAHKLCKENSIICIEDLNMEGMKKIWGKKISDLSFSSFVKKLEHIAGKYDTHIQKIDRYFPSSKMCGCGYKNKDLKLSDRYWTCEKCGTENHRDTLAANNIKTEGIRLYLSDSKTSLEANRV